MRKFIFKPEEATKEDSVAFDSAEKWAKAMNQLEKKLKQITKKKLKSSK